MITLQCGDFSAKIEDQTGGKKVGQATRKIPNKFPYKRNNSLLILWSVVDLLEGETMDERTDLESIIFGHFLLLSHMTKVKAD